MILGELRHTTAPELIRQTVEPCSVPIFTDEHGSGGSGTLVTYKGLKGILTASHVIASISNKKSIFLPCLLRKGTNDIWDLAEIPFCRILTIDDLSQYTSIKWTGKGLDIAIIQFEDPVFSSLIQHWCKRPLDLEIMRAKYLSNEHKYWCHENAHDWLWPIAGMPREGCHHISDDVKVIPYAGAYIGGGECKFCHNTLQNVLPEFRHSDADLIKTQIGPTQDILPKDFGGMSGGGIYQFKVCRKETNYQLDDFLLAGVFVAGDEEDGWLTSRGHLSLYDIFCGFLNTQLGG